MEGALDWIGWEGEGQGIEGRAGEGLLNFSFHFSINTCRAGKSKLVLYVYNDKMCETLSVICI